MRYLVRAIFIANLMAALTFPTSAVAIGNGFFIGFWQGVDTLDGSEILLSISDNNRDGVLEVRLTETFFATCIAENQGFSGSPGLIAGEGTVEGKTLTWMFSFKCYDPATNSLVEISSGTATLEANRKDKILVDSFGQILHRIGKR